MFENYPADLLTIQSIRKDTYRMHKKYYLSKEIKHEAVATPLG